MYRPSNLWLPQFLARIFICVVGVCGWGNYTLGNEGQVKGAFCKPLQIVQAGRQGERKFLHRLPREPTGLAGRIRKPLL